MIAVTVYFWHAPGTPFGRLEGKACCAGQYIFQCVQVAVINQLFSHHGDRLGNIAQRLVAFSEAGRGGAQAVFALGRASLLEDGDGFEGLDIGLADWPDHRLSKNPVAVANHHDYSFNNKFI